MLNKLHKTWLIASRDWLATATTRTFCLTLVLVPFIAAVLTTLVLLTLNLEDFLNASSGRTTDGQFNYAVVDSSAERNRLVRQEILRADLNEVFQFVNEQSYEALGTNKELGNLKSRLAIQPQSELMVDLIEAILNLNATIAQSEVNTDNHEFAQWWSENRSKLPAIIPGLDPYIEEALSEELDFETRKNMTLWALQQFRHHEGVIIHHNDSFSNSLVHFEVVLPFKETDRHAQFVKWYEQKLVQALYRYRIESIAPNITDEEIESLVVNTSVHIRTISENTQPSNLASLIQENLKEIFYFGLVVMMVLLGIILTISVVLEEKSTKLVEVILATVDPNQLLDGKILGVILVVISLWVSWLALFITFLTVAALLISIVRDSTFELLIAFGDIGSLFTILLYAVLGMTFFNYLVAGTTSKSVNSNEATLKLLPLLIIFSIGITVSWSMLSDPTTLWATILKFIPVFTPFAMGISASNLPNLYLLLGIFSCMILSCYVARLSVSGVFARSLLLESHFQ